MTPSFWTWYFYRYCENNHTDSHYYRRSRQQEFHLTKSDMLDEYCDEAHVDAAKHFGKLRRKQQLEVASEYLAKKVRPEQQAWEKELRMVRAWRRRR